MSRRDDYFENHRLASRFPWTLYHAPIERSLAAFLNEVVAGRAEASVLVVGGGLMHELREIRQGLRLTVIDVDARAVAAVLNLQHPNVVATHMLDATRVPPDMDSSFDAVYAKEVIEHVVETNRFLGALHRVLKPGGRLWLSTPNYGSSVLPILERTALELVARIRGFSRQGIHPVKFGKESLARALVSNAFVDVEVGVSEFRLALVAEARKPGAG